MPYCVNTANRMKSGIILPLIMLVAGMSCGQRKNPENATTMNNQSTENTELATFGNGCFWCTEAIFQRLKGVTKVVSGYSGGKVKNPTYKEVCTGLTGHAEVIQITYDPKVI